MEFEKPSREAIKHFLVGIAIAFMPQHGAGYQYDEIQTSFGG